MLRHFFDICDWKFVSLTQQETGSDVAKDSEVAEKKEEAVVAEAKTKTEEPAAAEVPPAQVEELGKEVCIPTSWS
jgi:hypothetical protein